MAEDDQLRQLEDKYVGYTVQDRDGDKIGKVDELFVDDRDREEYFGVKMGLFGLSGSTLIPMDIVRIHEQDRVLEVQEEKSRVKDAPTYSRDSDVDAGYEERIRDHFGLQQQESAGRGAYSGSSNGSPAAEDTTAGGTAAGDRTSEDRTSGDNTLEDRTSEDRTSGDRTAGDTTSESGRRGDSDRDYDRDTDREDRTAEEGRAERGPSDERGEVETRETSTGRSGDDKTGRSEDTGRTTVRRRTRSEESSYKEEEEEEERIV